MRHGRTCIWSFRGAGVCAICLATPLLLACAPSVTISAIGADSHGGFFSSDVGLWREGKTRLWAREQFGSLSIGGRALLVAEADVLMALAWLADQRAVRCPNVLEEPFDLRVASEVRFERGDALIYVFAPGHVLYAFGRQPEGGYACTERSEWVTIS